MTNNLAKFRLAHSAAKLAYSDSDLKIEDKAVSSLGENWFVLTDSSKLEKCDDWGFKGVAFLNLEKKQVIISCSGTRLGKEYDSSSSIFDMLADLKIASGLIPLQFHDDAVLFADYVYNFTSTMGNDFEYITTGHSLGGVNAQLLGIYLASKTNNISSVTFDHPGTEAMLYEFENKYECDLDLDSLKSNFSVINCNSPNFVNSYGKQFGEVYVADFGDSSRSTIFCNLLTQVQEHSLRNFTAPLKYGYVKEEPMWNTKYAYETSLITTIGHLVIGAENYSNITDYFCHSG